MSHDVIALLRETPDLRAVVSAMLATGEPIRPVQAGAGVVLADEQECPLVCVQEPQLIETPGEVNRLLGSETAAQVGIPVWWVEARAASARPGSVELAHRFAEELVRRFVGALWWAPPMDPPPHTVPGEEPVPGSDRTAGTGPRPAVEVNPQ